MEVAVLIGFALVGDVTTATPEPSITFGFTFRSNGEERVTIVTLPLFSMWETMA